MVHAYGSCMALPSCLCVCLSVCLSVCLFVCLSVCHGMHYMCTINLFQTSVIAGDPVWNRMWLRRLTRSSRYSYRSIGAAAQACLLLYRAQLFLWAKTHSCAEQAAGNRPRLHTIRCDDWCFGIYWVCLSVCLHMHGSCMALPDCLSVCLSVMACMIKVWCILQCRNNFRLSWSLQVMRLLKIAEQSLAWYRVVGIF